MKQSGRIERMILGCTRDGVGISHFFGRLDGPTKWIVPNSIFSRNVSVNAAVCCLGAAVSGL